MASKGSFQIDVDLVAGKTSGVQDVFDLATMAAKGYEGAQDKLYQKYGKTEQTITTKWVTDFDGTKVPVAEFKEVNKQADALVNKIKQENAVGQQSLTHYRQRINYLKQTRDAANKYVLAVDESGKKVRVINQEWVRLTKQIKVAEGQARKISDIKIGNINVSAVQRAGSTIATVAGKVTAIAGAFGLAAQAAIQFGSAISGPIIERTKQLQGLTLGLQQFGVSQENINTILDNAKVVSLTYGVALEDVEKATKRLTPAILASGGSLQESQEVVTALAARMTALGLNTEQSGRYIEAFAQVMGKGKVQGEELNQQFAELDGSLRPLLQNFLKTKYGVEDFEQAMKNGEITAAIFREFMLELAGPATERLQGSMQGLSQRIFQTFGPATLQQIQNFKSTLDTISIESLSNTFSGVGRELNAINLYFSQFFANLTTQFPALNQQIGQLATLLGAGLRIAIVAVGNGILLLLKAFDTLQGAIIFVLDELKKFPGVSQALEFVGRGVQDLFNKFQDLASVSPEALKPFREQLDATQPAIAAMLDKAAELRTAFLNGEISAEQYAQGMADINAQAREAGANLPELARKVAESTREQVKAIEEQKAVAKQAYDERSQQLKDEQTELQTVKAEISSKYDDELNDLNELKASILDRYSQEAALAGQLSREAKAASLEAQRAQLAELENKELGVDATRAEVAQHKARVAQMKAAIAQLEIQVKTQDDIAEVDEDIKETKKEQKNALVDINKELVENKRAQTELSKEYKDAIEGLDGQKEELENIASGWDEVSSAAGNVATDIKNISDGIKNMPTGNIQITTQTERLAKGGFAKKGQTYTVNEIGSEMFLNSAGVLRRINKPAWGQWTAPQDGYVIPADITRQLNTYNPVLGSIHNAAAEGISKINPIQKANSTDPLLADQLGKLSQAVDRINSKDWKLDVRIDGNNSLLNNLQHRR